jgi:flavin reductase (DIM6/NTAB) family NADH-FMN oxidoreductase RutF
MSISEDAQTRVARPLGQIPSGCYILTARADDKTTGMLASWVQQASFEPPCVTVAVKSGRPIADLIEQTGAFVLNAIDENPTPMIKHFGKGFGPDEPAFDGLPVRDVDEGVVIEDCASHLRCKVIAHADAGDHRIYVGEITDGGSHGDKKPYVHLRKDGFKY